MMVVVAGRLLRATAIPPRNPAAAPIVALPAARSHRRRGGLSMAFGSFMVIGPMIFPTA